MSSCPPFILLFPPLVSFSLSLFIPASGCVLHLSAQLGGSWTERMLGYVKVTRASCHPSLRFPLSSSIIEPLNQAPLHTGDVSERVCGTLRSRLHFSFGYLLFHRPAELTTLLDAKCVCVILVIISDVLYIGSSSPWGHWQERLSWNDGHNLCVSVW